jgi:hypothetical protein
VIAASVKIRMRLKIGCDWTCGTRWPVGSEPVTPLCWEPPLVYSYPQSQISPGDFLKVKMVATRRAQLRGPVRRELLQMWRVSGLGQKNVYAVYDDCGDHARAQRLLRVVLA